MKQRFSAGGTKVLWAKCSITALQAAGFTNVQLNEQTETVSGTREGTSFSVHFTNGANGQVIMEIDSENEDNAALYKFNVAKALQDISKKAKPAAAPSEAVAPKETEQQEPEEPLGGTPEPNKPSLASRFKNAFTGGAAHKEAKKHKVETVQPSNAEPSTEAAQPKIDAAAGAPVQETPAPQSENTTETPVTLASQSPKEAPTPEAQPASTEQVEPQTDETKTEETAQNVFTPKKPSFNPYRINRSVPKEDITGFGGVAPHASQEADIIEETSETLSSSQDVNQEVDKDILRVLAEAAPASAPVPTEAPTEAAAVTQNIVLETEMPAEQPEQNTTEPAVQPEQTASQPVIQPEPQTEPVIQPEQTVSEPVIQSEPEPQSEEIFPKQIIPERPVAQQAPAEPAVSQAEVQIPTQAVLNTEPIQAESPVTQAVQTPSQEVHLTDETAAPEIVQPTEIPLILPVITPTNEAAAEHSTVQQAEEDAENGVLAAEGLAAAEGGELPVTAPIDAEAAAAEAAKLAEEARQEQAWKEALLSEEKSEYSDLEPVENPQTTGDLVNNLLCEIPENDHADLPSAVGPKLPWYKTDWFTMLMLILLPPVGIVLMWVYKIYPDKARKIITAFFCVYTLLWGWLIAMPFLPVKTVDQTASSSSSATTTVDHTAQINDYWNTAEVQGYMTQMPAQQAAYDQLVTSGAIGTTDGNAQLLSILTTMEGLDNSVAAVPDTGQENAAYSLQQKVNQTAQAYNTALTSLRNAVNANDTAAIETGKQQMAQAAVTYTEIANVYNQSIQAAASTATTSAETQANDANVTQALDSASSTVVQ